jgi:oligopeptide transport system substrate-binding protein
VKTNFRAEYKLPLPKADYTAAKKYMADAMKELNLTTPPSIVWLTSDTELAGREAEYFQNILKNVLGINLKIDRQIFKERLAKMSSGDFDIVSAGWGPDYADPMTFADLKTSWNENNRGKWSNPDYDELIRKAQATVDPKIRMDAMAAAEKIMIDDVAVLPTFERTQVFLNSDRVTGIERHAIGPDPYFVWATIK